MDRVVSSSEQSNRSYCFRLRLQHSQSRGRQLFLSREIRPYFCCLTTFSNYIVLASRYFVSATELQHKNACSSDLCGFLSMFKILECLKSHSERKKKCAIEIGTCYASVANRLSYFLPVTPTSAFMHQVVARSI